MRVLLLSALVVVAVVAGCKTAYNNAYNQEMQQLESRQQVENAEQARLHAEAQRFAAVAYFATGSAELTPDAQHELRWFAQQMQPYPQARFSVQGFTDSTGSEAKNQALSGDRAQSVAAYLESLGIAPSRMVVQGLSAGFEAASNTTGQGRRDNRRVEVTVL